MYCVMTSFTCIVRRAVFVRLLNKECRKLLISRFMESIVCLKMRNDRKEDVNEKIFSKAMGGIKVVFFNDF